MNAKDADWPSLPPIRTSSYNARVSCETLNSHLSPPYVHPHSSSGATPSTSNAVKPLSKCADATPLGTASSSSPSHIFSSCFPHRFGKGRRHDGGKKGAFNAGGIFRSMFGPVAPRYSTNMSTFTSGVSPPPSRTVATSMSTSPSGRMKTSGSATSPINLMRSGGSTPHAGAVLRTSKGHAGHAFTMMPPDVVGKKKPPDYESDEPKSPEVTCIGKVRRKHYKATWDALVKEKHKDGKKKKGKVKRLSGEIVRISGEIGRKSVDCERKVDDGTPPTVAAKLFKQRSERRQSRDFEGFSTELDGCAFRNGDGVEQDRHDRKAVMGQRKEGALRHSFEGAGQDSLSSSKDNSEDSPPSRGGRESNKEPDDSSHHATVAVAPPSNCLLLMKKGSRNRSAHHALDVDLGTQWTWGQVLT